MNYQLFLRFCPDIIVIMIHQVDILKLFTSSTVWLAMYCYKCDWSFSCIMIYQRISYIFLGGVGIWVATRSSLSSSGVPLVRYPQHHPAVAIEISGVDQWRSRGTPGGHQDQVATKFCPTKSPWPRKAGWYTICGMADADGVLEDGEVEIGSALLSGEPWPKTSWSFVG